MAIVRRKATFTDKMRSILGYERTSVKGYGVHFVDVRIMYIVEDKMSSNVFHANSKAICKRYTKAGNMMINHQDVLSLPVNLGNDSSAERPLRITLVDGRSLYILFCVRDRSHESGR